MDTSDPAYMAPHGIGHKRLHSLCAKLEELSDDRCRQLLQALLRSCELVAGGAQAVTEDRAGMKVATGATLHRAHMIMHATVLKGME